MEKQDILLMVQWKKFVFHELCTIIQSQVTVYNFWFSNLITGIFQTKGLNISNYKTQSLVWCNTEWFCYHHEEWAHP